DGLEAGELGEEAVESEGAAAERGDGAIGFYLFGGEECCQFGYGGCEHDQQEDEESDACGAVVHGLVGDDSAPGPFLDGGIEPEDADDAEDHQGAEGQAVAEGFFHGEVCVRYRGTCDDANEPKEIEHEIRDGGGGGDDDDWLRGQAGGDGGVV